MDYKKYKTDRERAEVAHKVPPFDYTVLMDWEEEATDKAYKAILHHYASRAFHIDTM